MHQMDYFVKYFSSKLVSINENMWTSCPEELVTLVTCFKQTHHADERSNAPQMRNIGTK